jgi:hypothetical protein
VARAASLKNYRKIVKSKRHTSDNIIIDQVDPDMIEDVKEEDGKLARQQSSDLSGKSSTSPLKMKPHE